MKLLTLLSENQWPTIRQIQQQNFAQLYELYDFKRDL